MARPDSSFAGLPILLVDDRAADLEITKDRLLEAGYKHVTCVNGGAAAISFLDQIDSLAVNDTAGAAPGVVVVDIRMPPPDGYEVLARIKAMAVDRRPLALAVTGDTGSDTRIAALRAGASDFIAKSLDAVDLLVRVRNLSEMRLRQLELDHRASHDVLTGLANRVEVMRFLKEALRARAAGESMAVLFVDVDGFKDVNERLSQAVGDEVLMAVAQQLSGAVRPQDRVGRFGDDEFVVVLAAATDGREATAVADRVRSRVEAVRFEEAGHDLVVTISVGIAVSHSRSTPESLLGDADAALVRAKTSGGNRWVMCDDTIKSVEARSQEMAARIRTSLQANQFHAWFQPIVDLKTGDVVGREALARWTRPEGVTTRAAEFIGVANESGLLPELGGCIIRESIDAMGAFPAGQLMAVNVWPSQLNEDNFATDIEGWLAEAGADPQRLVVEIAERDMRTLRESARRRLIRLLEAGVGLYVIGVGSGVSSTSILSDYPVTGVKLDRSVVAGLSAEPDPAAMQAVSWLSDLAANLGLKRIVEDIETVQQEAIFVDMGWEHGQGWLYGGASPLMQGRGR